MTVSAKATFANAIREPVHWLNLVWMILATFAGILRLISAWLAQDSKTDLLGLLLTVLGLAAVYFYLRYMSSICFELSDDSFHCEEDWRKLTFTWKDIQAIKIESRKKRITVWERGKPRAMLYHGIAESESGQLIQFLQAKMVDYGIQKK